MPVSRTTLRRKLLRRPAAPNRRGAAMVEFAIMLPVFMLIVLGTIESCSMIFLKQSCEIAAYEGVRGTLITGTTLASVTFRTNNVLTQRGVLGAVVTVTPNDFPTRPYGTSITVNVTAPCDQNSILPSWFYQGRSVVGEVVMMKEYAP